MKTIYTALACLDELLKGQKHMGHGITKTIILEQVYLTAVTLSLITYVCCNICTLMASSFSDVMYFH